MKKIIIMVLALFCVLPLFAQRRARVDTYGNATVKIVWDDARVKLNGDNWAVNKDKELKKSGYSSVRINYFYLTPDNGASIYFFTDDAAGYYDYKYKITLYVLADGLWEKRAEFDYYGFQYNDALGGFHDASSTFEPLFR